MSPSESINHLEIPGEGNMNVVVRVNTSNGSLILKQSRPFVNKYPDISAPVERIDVEATFYQLTRDSAISSYLPAVIGYDSDNRILALEDLGATSDFTSLYQKENQLSDDQFEQSLDFIQKLASLSTDFDYPDNLSLRGLNHEHIFVYPFMLENGFNLDSVTPGLQDKSLPFKNNVELKQVIQELGEVYLASGTHLLHGDYYPGSWVNDEGSLKVIDPEFSFMGPPEFDLGVFLAHLKMAQQNEELVGRVRSATKDLDGRLIEKFEGIEIMRRIIGLAQLPLDLSLNEKNDMLQYAYTLIANK
jgi:5-methylthioribose kinase